MLTFIAVQQLLHVRFDTAMPFVLQHAVHHRVAHRAIAAQRVVADDAVFFCPQALNGFLAGKIQIVGAPTDHATIQGFKRVLQQHVFALSVHIGFLRRFGIPCVANFHPFDACDDVVVTG